MSLVTWDSGNLTHSFTNLGTEKSNIAVPSSRVYWEVKIDSSTAISDTGIGISGSDKKNYIVYFAGGRIRLTKGSSHESISGYPAYKIGDTIGIALDIEKDSLFFIVNGNVIYSPHKPSELGANDSIFAFIGLFNSYNKATFVANFGATPFKFDVPLGYLPYDYENAEWFIIPKNLIKSNDEIYTIDQDMELIKPVVSLPPSLEDFKEHGLEDLSPLITPQTRVVLPMEKISELGDGAEYNRKIYPEKYKRKIIKMREKV